MIRPALSYMSILVLALFASQPLFAQSHSSEPVEKKETQPAAAHEHLTSAGQHEHCAIHCIEPYAACSESEKVVEVLRVITKALAHGDLSTAAEYMDEKCTAFDAGSKKLIVGKEALMKELHRKFEEHGPGTAEPLLSYTIDHPYAKVTGDMAVVTFVAVKEYGGKKPQKLESRSTDIFVKREGKWKKMHYRSNWKRVS